MLVNALGSFFLFPKCNVKFIYKASDNIQNQTNLQWLALCDSKSVYVYISVEVKLTVVISGS